MGECLDLRSFVRHLEAGRAGQRRPLGGEWLGLQSFARQQRMWVMVRTAPVEVGRAGMEQVVDSVEEEGMVKRAATAHVEEEVEVDSVEEEEEEEEMVVKRAEAAARLKMRVWRRL